MRQIGSVKSEEALVGRYGANYFTEVFLTEIGVVEFNFALQFAHMASLARRLKVNLMTCGFSEGQMLHFSKQVSMNPTELNK
jgi:hypothetical protein